MGFHVVKLDAKQAPVKKVKVAILKRDIKPSSETYDAYLAQASSFAGANRDAEAFNKSVAAQGINKRNAQYIREMDYTIPGIETARDIIRWAFGEETKKGMVSEQVFDAQGKYVVALLVEKREKGIAPLEQIKTYIEPLVKREKKAEQIINKIDGAKSGSNDIYQIASKLNVPVDTLGMLTFASGNLPNFGPEPELIGSIFASEKGNLSAPVKGKMAVYSYIVDDFVSPPASINPDMLKMQVMSYFRSRISNDVFRYIKDKTDIVDNRIFYY
jgi:peptidyl-prolyl cis-trans isomerase D